MALLVACGNSICGNSAIAAVASVIEADGDDVAASISFTAILGVIAVVALPGLVPLLGLSDGQYGVLAGLTVYAVPQVLAATVPVGVLSVQIGALVKLIRVLTLGPVLFGVSLLQNALGKRDTEVEAPARPSLKRLVPWFILGFLALAVLRSGPDSGSRPACHRAFHDDLDGPVDGGAWPRSRFGQPPARRRTGHDRRHPLAVDVDHNQLWPDPTDGDRLKAVPNALKARAIKRVANLGALLAPAPPRKARY